MPSIISCSAVTNLYTWLVNGSLFLVFESCIGDSGNIISFSLEKGLDNLEISEKWACDETFKGSPSLWC